MSMVVFQEALLPRIKMKSLKGQLQSKLFLPFVLDRVWKVIAATVLAFIVFSLSPPGRFAITLCPLASYHIGSKGKTLKQGYQQQL